MIPNCHVFLFMPNSEKLYLISEGKMCILQTFDLTVVPIFLVDEISFDQNCPNHFRFTLRLYNITNFQCHMFNINFTLPSWSHELKNINILLSQKLKKQSKLKQISNLFSGMCTLYVFVLKKNKIANIPIWG